jgi:transposase
MRDYTGKIIYLGMDVHKETYSVTAILDGEILKRDCLSADPKGLLEYCKRFYPNAIIKSAYEAGFCGFSLHRYLIENGIDNIVVHPASIEVQINDKVKTDKRDSLKIAVHLSQNRLKCVNIPTSDQEDRRSVTRMRGILISNRSRCVNRIKGFFYYSGIKFPYKKMSQKAVKVLRTMDLLKGKKFQLEMLLDEWERITQGIKACDKQIEEQSLDDDLDKYYRSVPGVGSFIAQVLSNEMGDMSQFPNEKSLFSYCGLTPCEYSSGERIWKGHITRQGKSFLRKYLTQAAWKAVKIDSELKEVFDKMCMGIGKKRAIQAIARKLIGRIRACVMNREFYKVKEIEK